MRPSSLKAAAPAAAQASMSTSSSPFSPSVRAQPVSTWTEAATARKVASLTRSGLSIGGTVLAIATIWVKPPAAAA